MVDYVNKTDGFSLPELEKLMGEADSQPDWRTPATKACQYYDGDQLSSKIKQILRDRNQPEIVHNMVGPTIDGVLGLEARTRSDLMVSADDEKGEDIAPAINEKFKDIWRLTNADRACSDAYAAQLKAGMGWVEVTRNPHPMQVPYRVKFIHRKNIWWDWYSTEIDKSDARWKLYKKWVDIDEAKATFPEHAEVIEQTKNLWEDFHQTEDWDEVSESLSAGWHDYQSFGVDHSRYLDSERDQVLLQTVIYRKFKHIHVIRFSDGRVVEFDKNNKVHMAAYQAGKVELEAATIPVVREAWFVGPHRIVDRPHSAPTGMDNLIAFVGYQKDVSGEPYGLVSRMMSAQDGINSRVIRLNFLLTARRIIADDDATNLSTRELRRQAEKADGYIPLNPDRRNKNSVSDSINIQNDVGIASQQFELMQNDMRLIQDCAGVYNAMLGQDSNATSGVAIANLVEQGTTTLAELNDNFNYSRNKVAELLLAYIIEDMAKQDDISITVNRSDKYRRKEMVLNERVDEKTRNNDVARWRGHIALVPMQSTATWRQQQATLLTNAMSQLPEAAQASVVPMLVELLDLPNKEEFLNNVRQALGVKKDIDDLSEEERAALEQEQQKQQELEALQFQEIQESLRKLQLENEMIEAKITQVLEQAKTEGAKDDKLYAETQAINQQIKQNAAQASLLKQQLTNDIEQQLEKIEV